MVDLVRPFASEQQYATITLCPEEERNIKNEGNQNHNSSISHTKGDKASMCPKKFDACVSCKFLLIKSL